MSIILWCRSAADVGISVRRARDYPVSISPPGSGRVRPPPPQTPVLRMLFAIPPRKFVRPEDLVEGKLHRLSGASSAGRTRPNGASGPASSRVYRRNIGRPSIDTIVQ